MPSKKLLFAIIFFSITTIIGIAGYLYFINQKPALAQTIYSLPADSTITWQGNVGVEGGIPARTTEINCVTSYGVPTDGVSNSATAINNCLNGISSGQVAYLPAGTYALATHLTIPANKTLRGAGMNSTILSNEGGDSGPWIGIVQLGYGQVPTSTLLPITSGYVKGSTQITLSDASTISVGNFILINELNDASIPVTSVGYGGSCTWCDSFNGTRSRAQVAKVIAKNGNILTLEIPLYFTLSSGNSPAVMKLNSLYEYIGLESLTVKNGTGSSGGWRINIMIAGAANSWIKDVKVETCGKRCIDMRRYYYRVEIRDSYMTKCIDHTNSDACYGTQVAEGSSSLIENNIYYDTSNGPSLMWGASGNVVGYNYAYGVHRTYQMTDWFWPTTWAHGAHTSHNLWEGNVMTGLNWDSYWASHSHNTAFRNRFTSKDEIITHDDYHQETAAIITEKDNTNMNIIGNVLGLSGWSNHYEQRETFYWTTNSIYGTGGKSPSGGSVNAFNSMLRHMNYDYFTNSVKQCNSSGEPGCQGGSTNQTLPPSLYLSSKPSWWGSSIWPSIGPDVQGYFTSIPAKDRFLTGSTPPPTTYQCSDNLDNDSDSLTDYPNDSGCSSSTDNNEYNAPVQNLLPNQIIEAESGQLTSMQTGTSGSDTYIYTNTNDIGSAKYTFDIPTSGQYKMEAKVNSDNDAGQNSFYVGLDNESAQGNILYAYNIFPLAIGFVWDEVSKWGDGQTGNPPISQFDPMTWNLTQGTHTFTFYGREFNTWLDQIRLVSITTDTTPPSAPTGLIVN